jgi:hypothetical protein
MGFASLRDLSAVYNPSPIWTIGGLIGLLWAVKTNFPAIILAAGIVIAAIIYALSTRYELWIIRSVSRDITTERPVVLDRWTGKTR